MAEDHVDPGQSVEAVEDAQHGGRGWPKGKEQPECHHPDILRADAFGQADQRGDKRRKDHADRTGQDATGRVDQHRQLDQPQERGGITAMLGLNGIADDGLPRFKPQDQVDDPHEGFHQRKNPQTRRAKCAGGDKQGGHSGNGYEKLAGEGPAEVSRQPRPQ